MSAQKLPPYKDEALLVAHLLGGRYGYDERKHPGTMQEQVAGAIEVAREIRRQLALLDPVAMPEKEQQAALEI